MADRQDAEPRRTATGTNVRTWLSRIGLVGCILFMVKGLAWIVIAVLAGYGLIGS